MIIVYITVLFALNIRKAKARTQYSVDKATSFVGFSPLPPPSFSLTLWPLSTITIIIYDSLIIHSLDKYIFNGIEIRFHPWALEFACTEVLRFNGKKMSYWVETSHFHQILARPIGKSMGKKHLLDRLFIAWHFFSLEIQMKLAFCPATFKPIEFRITIEHS